MYWKYAQNLAFSLPQNPNDFRVSLYANYVYIVFIVLNKALKLIRLQLLIHFKHQETEERKVSHLSGAHSSNVCNSQGWLSSKMRAERTQPRFPMCWQVHAITPACRAYDSRKWGSEGTFLEEPGKRHSHLSCKVKCLLLAMTLIIIFYNTHEANYFQIHREPQIP